MSVRQRLLNTTGGALAAALAALPAAAWAQTAPAAAAQRSGQPNAEAARDQAGLQGPDTTTTADGRTSVQQTDTSETAGDTPETEELEGVVITGSRIVRPQYEGNIPGVQVDAAQIQNRGFTNALDVLNDIPLVGPGTALNTNGGQPSSLGVAFIDLLDLGTQRTLTLVNGRRFVSGNAASLFVAGNETGTQVDVNVIPVSLIERVDVLTVGGAAAYGSDAIAGVINYILKDNYEGAEVQAIAGVTERGTNETLTLRTLVGRNFLNDRANVAVAYEYNFMGGFQDVELEFRNQRPAQVPNPFNGGLRNPAFSPTQAPGGTNTAFLPAASDLQPQNTFIINSRSIQRSEGGTILNVLAPVNLNGATAQVGPTSGPTFVSTQTQLVPGAPVGCIAVSAAQGFCAFAPSGTALPAGVTAAQVFTRFGVTPPAGLTPAQQNTLALEVIRANRPTPREFFAANPGIDQNLLFGTFVTALPDVPNTDPATNALLARRGVPIRFNAQGDVETYRAANLSPDLPGVTDSAPNSEGFNTVPFTTRRVEQDRHIFNVFGRFDLTDKIELFTENLYADVKALALSTAASGNTSITTAIETLSIVTTTDNPFLDANDRAALAAAGITGQFQLSRTNQDIVGSGEQRGHTKTWRSAVGIRGDLDLFGRGFDWEASVSRGRVESKIEDTASLRDVEFNLAIDVARNASGEIVCRSQLNPAAFIGTSPTGVVENLTRATGPDGISTQILLRPKITAEQIAACRPLNPFGINQMSEASKQYVQIVQEYNNISEQTFFQGFVSGSLFDLPAGPLAFSTAYEYRIEALDFFTNELNRQGRGRTAPSAQTSGETRTQEAGVEFLIPLFGRDFRFPGMHTLDISPAVRYSKQEGEAPSFRDLQGRIIEQTSEGDWARIDSIGIVYKPIQDLTFRGNKTKSIRQPNVTELFLGGQPAFNALTQDPCSPGLIAQGPRPETRKANCIAGVISAGVAANPAAAEAFLATFTPNNASAQGGFAGSPGLQPEQGDSYTVGMVVEPRFLPRFRASVDYVQVTVTGLIFPVILNTAAQFCYDSPTFPDPTPQVGANTCAAFTRTNVPGNVFNIDNGFQLNYINLGGQRVKGYNYNADYSLDLNSVGERIGLGEIDLGELRLRFNAFNLSEFGTSGSGMFDDTTYSDGSINLGQPVWRSTLTAAWSRGPLDVSLTWNRTGEQFNNGGAGNVTPETSSILRFDPVHIFSSSIGYSINKQYRVQFTADNLTDEVVYGDEGALSILQVAGSPDNLGRRYRLLFRANF
jgi:outer membrane receptor protein involved in Fe transport